MARTPVTQIDKELCTGCGACIDICPSKTLSLVDGKAEVTGDDSMQCGQCAAVCPEGAVRVVGVDDPKLPTVSSGTSTAALVDIMRNRRSVRRYRPESIEASILEDLVKIGTLAPSGTNAQKWTFTILPTRDAMTFLAGKIAVFFERINKMADNPALRMLSSIFGGGVLGKYYRRHYKSVKEAIDDWLQNGRDHLFHGATAGIVIAERPGASCAAEDALLASQNIVLAAHTMGLGTCLIGFAVEAMKRDLSIQESIGIPKDETVYSVIAIGRPDVAYVRPAGRKVPVVRTFLPNR
jgi:nitroreductase/NAD-dependent dihydropyrimidine dehydrogenase PreA subunit